MSADRVGDVGHRVAGPIEPVADRPAAMFQRKMGQPSAAGQVETLAERPIVERRPHGKQRPGEQMLLDRPKVLRQPVERDPPQRMDLVHAEQEGQPDDVVEVGVGDEDIQFGRGEVFRGAIDARAGVEHDAALGQQQARRLPPLVRMIAGRAEKD